MTQKKKVTKKVYFYFGSHAHPYYEKLVASKLKNIKYITSTQVKRQKHVNFERFASFQLTAKKIILWLFHIIGVPKIKILTVSNGIALVHSSQYLLWCNKPYVVDFEDISVFAWYDYKIIRKPHVKWIITKMLSSPNCRAILPWTEAAKKGMLNTLPKTKKLEHKTYVLYPGFNQIPSIDRDGHAEVKFLFVGKKFYEKGGLDSIQAFEKLVTKLKKERPDIHVKFHLVSDVPKEVKNTFRHLKELIIHPILPPDQVDSLYRECDVFVMPTHFDTFGFVFVEALARGLPCIGINNFSCPEIVTEGKTGFLADNFLSRYDQKTFVQIDNSSGIGSEKYIEKCKHPNRKTVESIFKAMFTLATDTELRKQMSINARNEVVNGKFSVKNQNKLLQKIYA